MLLYGTPEKRQRVFRWGLGRLVLLAFLGLPAEGQPLPEPAAPTASAGPETASSHLTGFVRPLGQRTPLSGVPVTAIHLASGKREVVTTDGRGWFAFSPLPPGAYHLRVEVAPSLLGFGKEPWTAERRIDVRPGGNRWNLRPAPPEWRRLFLILWAGLLAIMVTTALVALSLVIKSPAKGSPEKELESTIGSSSLVPPSQDATKISGRVSLEAAGLWGSTFTLFHLLAPLAHPLDLRNALLLSALSLVWVTVATIAAVVMAPLPRSWLLPGFIVGLLFEIGMSQMERSPYLEAMGRDLGLLAWTTCAGILMVFGLRRHRFLIMTALVIAIADLYSVFFGPARAVASGEATGWIQTWSQISLLVVPMLGSNTAVPLIGAGDFLFSALFLEAARKFGLGLNRTCGAVLGAFVLGLIVLRLTNRAIPALVFIGPAFLGVNWKQIRPEPNEWRPILGVCGGVMLFFTVLAVLKKFGG